MKPATMTGELVVLTNTRERVFQRSIIAGAREVSAEAGLELLVVEAPRPNEAGALVEGLEAEQKGLLLVADVLPDRDVARLHHGGTTITLVSHRIEGLAVPAVVHDNHQGVELLARHLLDRCLARSPIFVKGSSKQQDAREREHAFRRELMRRGLPLEESRFLTGDFEPERAAAALDRYLEEGRELDSLLAADYLMAIACLEVLERHRLRVPEDVAVLGFGDGPEAQAAGLTTVAADVVELGRRSGRQLIGQLQGLRIRGLTLLSTTLLERKTTVTTGEM